MGQFGNLQTTGDPARDLQNYRIELERRLGHMLRNIDISNIILGLSNSRLVATNAGGGLASVTTLTDWIAGTSNQITVTSDGDGTVTLSLPQSIHTGATLTLIGLLLSGLTANRAIVTDGSKNLSSSATTSTEIGYLSGVTSAIQTQLDGKELTLTKGNITGTANQVSVSGGTGACIGAGVTLSTPQNIHTGATPTFTGINISGNKINIATSKTPSSASDTGTTGDICWDSNYIYVCIATDAWKRIAISTW